MSDETKEWIAELRRAHEYLDEGKPFFSGRDCAAMADLIEQQVARIAELEAARLAYASEFPPDAEGLPDVGSIHANIRAMKEMIRRIPTTPQQMIDFIGPHFNGMTADEWDEAKFPPKPSGDLSRVSYSISVHDLLSAFDWADLGKASIDAIAAAKEKTNE